MVALWRRLAQACAESGAPAARDMAGFLAKYLADCEADLKRARPTATRSAYAAGMEQGLLDFFPTLATDIRRDSDREILLETVRQIIADEYPAFFAEHEAKLKAILAAGRIRSPRQFYRVRSRIDEIEGIEKHGAELDRLYRLIGNYEHRRRPKRKRTPRP